jgi:hypothetical protein
MISISSSALCESSIYRCYSLVLFLSCLSFTFLRVLVFWYIYIPLLLSSNALQLLSMSLVHLVVFANVPSVDHEDGRKQKDQKSEATKHDLKR